MNSSQVTQSEFYRAYRFERLSAKNRDEANLLEETFICDPCRKEFSFRSERLSFFAILAADECLNSFSRDRLACKKPQQILRAQEILRQSGKVANIGKRKLNLFRLIEEAFEILTTIKLNDIKASK